MQDEVEKYVRTHLGATPTQTANALHLKPQTVQEQLNALVKKRVLSKDESGHYFDWKALKSLEAEASSVLSDINMARAMLENLLARRKKWNRRLVYANIAIWSGLAVLLTYLWVI